MKKLIITLVLAIWVTSLTGCSVPSTDSVNDTLTDTTNAITDSIDTTTDTTTVSADTTDPISYNDSIVDIQTKALDAYNDYDNLVQDTEIGGDFDAVETARVKTLKTIEDLKTTLSKFDGFKWDTNLRDGFVKNLSSLTTSLANEEKELIELYKSRSKLDWTDFPEDEVNREKELLDNIWNRDDLAYQDIVKIQEAFADKYNYDLED